MKKFFLLSALAYAGFSFAAHPGLSNSSLETKSILAKLPEDDRSALKKAVHYIEGNIGPIQKKSQNYEFRNIRELLEKNSIKHPDRDDDLLYWIKDELRNVENPLAQLNNDGLTKLSNHLADDMASQYVCEDPYKFLPGFDKLLKELNIDPLVILKHGIPKHNDWVARLKSKWGRCPVGDDILRPALSEESTLAIKACFLLRELEEQQKVADLEKYKDMSGARIVDIAGLDKAAVLKALFNHALLKEFFSEFNWSVSEHTCREYLEASTKNISISKLWGRELSVNLEHDWFYPGVYNCINGEGVAQAAIAALRAQQES